MPQIKNRIETTPRYRLLVSGVVINFLMGVMYGWSILLAPLEEVLNLTRSTLSIVPGLALLCFTFGVYIHDTIIWRRAPAIMVLIVIATAGVGHLLFYFFPRYTPTTELT